MSDRIHDFSSVMVSLLWHLVALTAVLMQLSGFTRRGEREIINSPVSVLCCNATGRINKSEDVWHLRPEQYV